MVRVGWFVAPADVLVTPSSAGMPGAALIQQILGWLTQIALWGSVASVLVGAAVYGLAQHAGNASGGMRGRQMALAGAIGAALAGLAPSIVNLMFKAAGA